MTYYDNSNQLKAVNDVASNLVGRGDFYNYTGYDPEEFHYDANGNMTENSNMNSLSPIQYNHLNLPTNMSFGIASRYCSYNYKYDAVGNKLSSTVSAMYNYSAKTDYCGNFIYENGVLKRIIHDEGVVDVLSNNKYWYQFFIKDLKDYTTVI